ncbi:MAG: hypothetical protein V2A56_06255 [bacterium]
MSQIQKGQVESALKALLDLERDGAMIQGQLSLKALCLLKLGRPRDARTALENELKRFPPEMPRQSDF